MENENLGLKIGLVAGGFVGIILLIVLLGSFGVVSAGQVGVKTRLGKVVGTVQPGLYFKVPFIEGVHKMDVKTRTISYDKNGAEGDAADTSQLFGASKDLQDVKIGVVVNYRVNANKVDVIYSSYSSVENFESNVIESIIRKTVKSLSAQYSAEELVTKRAEFNDAVTKELTQELGLKDVIVEQSNITNFEFSKSFQAAIDAKVTATQNAEAAKNKLEQIKYEAEQQIVTAKATAESQRISAAALQTQGGESYVQLKVVEKWDGKGCTTNCYGSSAVQPLPIINLNK